MNDRYDGKAAIITGAAVGIGRATALRLAREGAAVALLDLQAQPLEALAAELRDEGARVVTLTGDVTNPATSKALAEECESTFGHVDVLVNNVGIIVLKSLEETTLEDFDRLMRVNCQSHLLAMQAVLPAMRRAGRGSIVNVASVGAFVALPNVSAYCPSKSAVLGLTRAAAVEFNPIRVNAVCPGGVETDMSRVHMDSFEDKDAAVAKLTGRQIINRYAQPEEIAAIIAFVASDEASFMTGAAVAADAGHTAC